MAHDQTRDSYFLCPEIGGGVCSAFRRRKSIFARSYISTLTELGISATTFYRWYDRYSAFGEAGLADRNSGPGRVLNRIPDDVRRQIQDLALDEPEFSPRELAVTFTDTKDDFVSEASVYRLLKDHDLITSPALVVIKASDAFQDQTTAPNLLWQTDFTYRTMLPKRSVASRRPNAMCRQCDATSTRGSTTSFSGGA